MTLCKLLSGVMLRLYFLTQGIRVWFSTYFAYCISFDFYHSVKKKKSCETLALEESDETLRLKIIILAIFRITNTLTYFGLTLTATSLAGNCFLSFFFMACVEYISFALECFMLNKQVTFESVFFNCLCRTQYSVR